MSKRQSIVARVSTFETENSQSYNNLSLAERIAQQQGTAPVTHEAVTSWNFALTEDSLSQELNSLLSSLKRCLELRAEYQAISLQRLGDNPKDWDDWKIYPPPPPPSYKIIQQGDRTIYEKIPEADMPPEALFDYNGCIDCLGLPGKDPQRWYRMGSDGVYRVYSGDENAEIPEIASKVEKTEEDPKNPVAKTASPQVCFHVPTMRDYYVKLEYLLQVIADGPTKSFAFRRLRYLESKFQMYTLLNDYQEMAESKKVPHRDFYNVRKVDTHVHHSSCMNQKHLLRFIKYKLRKNPDEVVIFRDGKNLTLDQVFQSLKLTAYDLSIDTLDMHAHKDSFHRFDKFNLKYNPVGESRLREIFLKTDNLIKGVYLAELTQEVFTDLKASKYQQAEYRVSIYGRSTAEWEKMAAWVVDNKLFSNNVRWLIQVPRLYSIYYETGAVKNFAELLRNVFEPLFEVTQNPSKYPKLHIFLQRVVGFDSVDDESKPERRIWRKYPLPKEWDFATNPPYSYWCYCLFANICSLNKWRQARGMNTFVFRPHAGEAGDPEHLAAAFLTAQGINHGILLRKVPALQYLYYLDQVGIAMSPLSNNALFLEFERNPFPKFFQRGLNVSLSTDDPLQFHFTKEPLMEEYSVAAQIWKLSSADMCEIARNSVMQSGWELGIKKQWLGPDCDKPGPASNDISKTNVPNIRMVYRWETLLDERMLVFGGGESIPQRMMDVATTPTQPDRISAPIVANFGTANSAAAAAVITATRRSSILHHNHDHDGRDDSETEDEGVDDLRQTLSRSIHINTKKEEDLPQSPDGALEDGQDGTYVSLSHPPATSVGDKKLYLPSPWSGPNYDGAPSSRTPSPSMTSSTVLSNQTQEHFAMPSIPIASPVGNKPLDRQSSVRALEQIKTSAAGSIQTQANVGDDVDAPQYLLPRHGVVGVPHGPEMSDDD